MKTAAPIAVFVGTLLSLVNQGQVVASGRADVATWIRIGVNYVVPFLVASVGYIAPFRNSGQREAVPRVECAICDPTPTSDVDPMSNDTPRDPVA